jgi:hypothetical protein
MAPKESIATLTLGIATPKKRTAGRVKYASLARGIVGQGGAVKRAASRQEPSACIAAGRKRHAFGTS